jgi:hypothetical protein
VQHRDREQRDGRHERDHGDTGTEVVHRRPHDAHDPQGEHGRAQEGPVPAGAGEPPGREPARGEQDERGGGEDGERQPHRGAAEDGARRVPGLADQGLPRLARDHLVDEAAQVGPFLGGPQPVEHADGGDRTDTGRGHTEEPGPCETGPGRREPEHREGRHDDEPAAEVRTQGRPHVDHHRDQPDRAGRGGGGSGRLKVDMPIGLAVDATE